MPASSHPLTSSQTPATLLPTATLVDKTSRVGRTSSQEFQQRETEKHELIHKPQPTQNKPQPIQNRVQVLLVHIPKFSIQGQARLAAEVGVSRSTISRLVHGRINPSYRLARGVTDALERVLRKPLDMREVFSTDGTYLTPSGCALCQCAGCLPDRAYDPDGNLRPEWEGQKPGDWSVAPAADSGPSADPEFSARQDAVTLGGGHAESMDDGKEAR